MAEILEIFDASYKSKGTAPRSEAHKKGLWHHTFHCWIIRRREGRDYVLFQKRADIKKDWPSKLDITAAGHVSAEESLADGIREIREELGVSVDYDSLYYLGMRTEVLQTDTMDNREFQHVYLFETDKPIESFTLQAEEVGGLIELEISEGLKLFSGEVDSVCCDAVLLQDGRNIKGRFEMRRDSVIERPDCYYKTLLIMAERALSGERYLSI